MPRAQSRPPGGSDDRTTERRIIPSVPSGPGGADSTRELHQEDFLFHLYRGSELLQENRVLEAKEELEFALTVQPYDPKGQDLLGAVYFRLGLYQRALQIYEALEGSFPNDASIKINLALVHLKTGRPEPARRLLEDAVRINPEHRRGWGYLGLALQKLGEPEQAQIAFERGGHEMMARRVSDRSPGGSSRPSAPSALDPGVRGVAETAFSELDAGELRFALAQPAIPRPSDGIWHALELGDVNRTAVAVRTAPPPPPRPPSIHETATVPPPSSRAAPDASASAPRSPGSRAVAPDLLALSLGQSPTLLPGGVAVARVGDDVAFATRLDALRVVSGSVATRVLHRRTRDAETAEVLGGIGSPFVRITGDAHVVIGPRAGQTLVVVPLDNELAFVREESLLGFELRLAYENGRLALDPPGEGARSNESVHVAQLRGLGALVLEAPGPLASLPCSAGRPLSVRREWIVAWLGRLVPHALQPAEAPSGQRGLVAFSGEGTVLVCPG